MRKEVFMAGTGGQGVLLIGQLLTQAALEDGLEVSWFPIYSPEVRGGTSNCTVVVADGAVGSPVSGSPASMLLMDQLSVDTHVERVKPGGLVVVNSTLVESVGRDDVELVAVPATQSAAELGNERVTNMIMLGAYVGCTEVVSWAALEAALKVVLPERHHKFLPLNIQSLQLGAKMAAEAKG
jgi:2-oxoglutarate ferredoxin oxidoreductase subunit gamma